MSSPFANLSMNLVDWALHERLVGAMAAGPEALERSLGSLDLSPAQGDARVVALFDEGRFPEVLHFAVLAPGLRVDRERFLPMAVRLFCEEREAAEEGLADDLVAGTLEQLAFVSGSTRMVGDLWLVEPLTILAALSQRFRAFVGEGAPPGADRDALEVVMGFHGARSVAYRRRPDEGARGVGAFVEDALFPPDAVEGLAAELATLRPEEHPRGDLGRVRAEVAEYTPALLERGAALANPGEDPLDALFRQALRDVTALFARASSEGRGVDVCWHANP